MPAWSKAFSALAAGLIAASAALAAQADVLERGPSASVVAVIDGDTLVLDDASQVRLVGIQAPKLPLGRAGFVAWPLAEDAKAALERLALHRRVTLRYGGRRLDRHGRRLAHLFRDDGLWLQGALISAGMARVYSFADNRARIAGLLALESAARAAGRGLWRNRFYRVRTVDQLDNAIDSFQLVEGRVVAADQVRGRIYWNFGPDWRTDFTVTVAPADRARFESSTVSPSALVGRRVRVRGWIKRYNGPMIEATHPEQIELLD